MNSEKDNEVFNEKMESFQSDFGIITYHLTLGYLGTVSVTEHRKTMSIICTVIYFSYFLLMPIYTSIEKTKPVPDRL